MAMEVPKYTGHLSASAKGTRQDEEETTKKKNIENRISNTSNGNVYQWAR